MLAVKAKNLFLFLSLLFAGAYAQDVYNVYKNNTLLTDNTATIMYGENVTFSIRNAPIGYGWCWASTLEPTFCLSSTLSWIPYIDVNADEVKHIKITGKKAGALDISIDLTVTIEHRPSYAVTFDSDGGSPVPAAQNVLKDSLAIKPPNPEKTGHKFNHWYISTGAENAPFSFATRITEDIALKASWTILKYGITWNFDNGSTNQIDSVEYNKLPTQPANPTKTSKAYAYAFSSWSPAIAAATEHKTYTAQYTATPINYTITYVTNDPSITQPSQTYNITNTIAMPVFERCGFRFDGWYENKDFLGSPIGTIFSPTESNIGNKTFYLNWTPSLATPSESLLKYPDMLPREYNGQEISPIIIEQKQPNECTLGKITTLYNGSEELPKDAGTYIISAKIEKSDHYEAETIELSQKLIINKKSVTVVLRPGYSGEDKEYDDTRKAEIKNLKLDGFSPDNPAEDVDYTITALFASPNAGKNIAITGVIDWIKESPLNKNYIISPNSITFNTTANILPAEGFLKIRPPQDYMLANKTKPAIISKNSFISEGSITWKYKREDGEWSEDLPNRVGDWIVMASFPGDDAHGNYTGAADSAEFYVIRGDLPVSRDDSEIESEDGVILKREELSNKHKEYFVVEPDNCSISSAKIKITLNEPDLILKIDGNPIPQNGEDCDKSKEEYCNTHYYIDYNFSKLAPGTDKFIYVLTAKYDEIDKFEERDTIMIERPVPFENVIAQKWNSTLVVNNNYQNNRYKTNGGYNFDPESLKWFIDGEEETACRGLQFCSADSSGAKALNPSSQYTVQMNYQKEGETFRISTCYGSPKLKASASPAQSVLEKRVLGISGKTAPQGVKIYNSKGERVSGESPGVYLIENK